MQDFSSISDSVVNVRSTNCASDDVNTGYGFIVDGLVVTAAHTIEEAPELTWLDGNRLEVEVVMVNTNSDLAILKPLETSPRVVDNSLKLSSRTDTRLRMPVFDPEVDAVIVGTSQPKQVAFEGRPPIEAIELSTSVSQGDSGLPVLDSKGAIAGMIFANEDSNTSWAVAASEIASILEISQLAEPPTLC